jgi:hypothetical protein
VQIILEDDYDGGSADETVSFALDGAEYEIDLSSKNASGLREHKRYPSLGVGERPRCQQPRPRFGRGTRGVREGSCLI